MGQQISHFLTTSVEKATIAESLRKFYIDLNSGHLAPSELLDAPITSGTATPCLVVKARKGEDRENFSFVYATYHGHVIIETKEGVSYMDITATAYISTYKGFYSELDIGEYMRFKRMFSDVLLEFRNPQETKFRTIQPSEQEAQELQFTITMDPLVDYYSQEDGKVVLFIFSNGQFQCSSSKVTYLLDASSGVLLTIGEEGSTRYRVCNCQENNHGQLTGNVVVQQRILIQIRRLFKQEQTLAELAPLDHDSTTETVFLSTAPSQDISRDTLSIASDQAVKDDESEPSDTMMPASPPNPPTLPLPE